MTINPIWTRYLNFKGVSADKMRKLESGSGKVDLDDNPETAEDNIDLSDGLNASEKQALGITDADNGLDHVIGQGWHLDSDSDRQVDVNSTVIEDIELDKFFAAVDKYADAWGIPKDVALQLFLKVKLGRDNLETVKAQRVKTEKELDQEYTAWAAKNSGKTYKEFLQTKEIKADSVIIENNPADTHGIAVLVHASAFAQDIQTGVLGVAVPIKTAYTGPISKDGVLAWVRGAEGFARQPKPSSIPPAEAVALEGMARRDPPPPPPERSEPVVAGGAPTRVVADSQPTKTPQQIAVEYVAQKLRSPSSPRTAYGLFKILSEDLSFAGLDKRIPPILTNIEVALGLAQALAQKVDGESEELRGRKDSQKTLLEVAAYALLKDILDPEKLAPMESEKSNARIILATPIVQEGAPEPQIPGPVVAEDGAGPVEDALPQTKEVVVRPEYPRRELATETAPAKARRGIDPALPARPVPPDVAVSEPDIAAQPPMEPNRAQAEVAVLQQAEIKKAALDKATKIRMEIVFKETPDKEIARLALAIAILKSVLPLDEKDDVNGKIKEIQQLIKFAGARQMIKDGKDAPALVFLKEITADTEVKAVDRYSLWSKIGDCADKLGKYDEALMAYQKAKAAIDSGYRSAQGRTERIERKIELIQKIIAPPTEGKAEVTAPPAPVIVAPPEQAPQVDTRPIPVVGSAEERAGAAIDDFDPDGRAKAPAKREPVPATLPKPVPKFTPPPEPVVRQPVIKIDVKPAQGADEIVPVTAPVKPLDVAPQESQDIRPILTKLYTDLAQAATLENLEKVIAEYDEIDTALLAPYEGVVRIMVLIKEAVGVIKVINKTSTPINIAVSASLLKQTIDTFKGILLDKPLNFYSQDVTYKYLDSCLIQAKTVLSAETKPTNSEKLTAYKAGLAESDKKYEGMYRIGVVRVRVVELEGLVAAEGQAAAKVVEDTKFVAEYKVNAPTLSQKLKDTKIHANIALATQIERYNFIATTKRPVAGVRAEYEALKAKADAALLAVAASARELEALKGQARELYAKSSILLELENPALNPYKEKIKAAKELIGQRLGEDKPAGFDAKFKQTVAELRDNLEKALYAIGVNVKIDVYPSAKGAFDKLQPKVRSKVYAIKIAAERRGNAVRGKTHYKLISSTYDASNGIMKLEFGFDVDPSSGLPAAFSGAKFYFEYLFHPRKDYDATISELRTMASKQSLLL